MHPDPHSPLPNCPCGCRHKLVAHIREQIEAGTYLTTGKLEAAADRLVGELAGQAD